jgi:hypothetical protein
MNRRNFVSMLGTSTFLSVAKGLAGPAKSPTVVGGRTRLSLQGNWERYIEGELYDRIQVPSSQHLVGSYHLKCSFLLPRLAPDQRALLHFEGITYFGRATVNGVELGTMSLYVPYDFDFTPHAKEGGNELVVAIADLLPDAKGAGKDELALGVNPGWEAYGGIIRDVWVETRPAAYIDNLRFGYTLNDAYTRAACRVQAYIWAARATSGELAVSLSQDKSEVARARRHVDLQAGPNEAELGFDVNAPALWSPEAPNLYELSAVLKTDNGEDRWACRTGVREIRTRGPEFLLNGKPLVLRGVCRHDMWKEQGFTLTRQQMLDDMRMIKDLGCNFVRLVHYPHHRHIVELADELGLLVSEEPGFWGMDFTTMPPSMVELGYRIMERTIRRDWNSPSVFAWLLGNECTLTVEYLKEGKARCRKLDPLNRPVSFANDMPMEEAKPIFEQAGMDFFDQHLYPSDQRDYNRVAEFYAGSLPLTFTEWGWETIGDEVIFPEKHTDAILGLIQKGQLAGHAFWSWQDIREYSRIDWLTQDGILLSGVVTEARDLRKDWCAELTGLFQGRRQEVLPHDVRPHVLPLKWQVASPGATFSPLDLQALVDSPEGQKSWAAVEAAMAKFWATVSGADDQWKRTGSRLRLWKGSELKIAGVPFRVPVVEEYARPVALTPEVPAVSIPIGQSCAWLHILGQVTLPQGYPVVGKRGQTVADYEVVYADGSTKVLPVRHGIEVAQANLIHVATRINPVATTAQPALKFVKDAAREQYQVLLWSVAVANNKVRKLACRLNGGQHGLLIFAVTAERV